MIQYLVIALLITGLGAFFAIGMYLNKKTPMPEGHELPSLACEHCTVSTCSYAKPNRVQEIKEEIKKNLNIDCEEVKNQNDY
ncbi:MAG TPA: hypothetical protein VIK84_00410 [Haloplasmataceae bacterium]